MKAAVYNPYWDSLGGGERYTASFIRLLLDSHWQVDIWWPENKSLEIKNRFSIDVSSANFCQPKSPLGYDLLFWVSDGSLPTSLSKRTIIHFQFPFTGVNGRSLTNFIKSRFYTFVVNSEFTKKFIDNEYDITSTVIYPPIDTSKFSPGEKTKTILYVGRFSNLTQAKGQSVLIDSFKQVYKKIPGWKLILAGGTSVGSDDRQLSALKNSLRGYPIQIITDPKFSELQKLYAQSTLFWSASGYGIDEASSPLKVEHFGITVVEAMSAGCIPIIPNRGGHKEIIDSGTNGYLWDNQQQLQDITLDLIDHPQAIESLSRSAIAGSKIFDIGEFNSGFTKLLNI